MIDLHCHIIPGVDDGAESARIACQMAELSLRSGVDTIVATPHCNLQGSRHNYRGRTFTNFFSMFRALLMQHDIPLRVLPGAEIFAHGSNLQELLKEERVVTLNHSRYLLVEFNFASSKEELNSLLSMVTRYGYIPVVAHPERYVAVQNAPGLAVQWYDKGYVIQLNKGSLLGRLGQAACDTAQYLLSAQIAHVVASDAHDMRSRAPGFQSLIPLLEELCDQEYRHKLLTENPYKIVTDQDL
ncbi:MAG: hypothetical protein IKM59_04600 [Oscillospiraceae bacterium]|nr:hypothetical protein [Oscillospiraceae bacterium]